MTTIPPGPHGGDAHRLADALGCDIGVILDLSASLNPLAPDCRPAIAQHLGALDRYPDDRAATAALAAAMHVDVDRLVLTNGGAEAIALVAQLRPVGWADEFDFSLYRRHLSRLDPAGPAWRSDPHNPTGALAPPELRTAVRDEAFYLLATGDWTRGDADTTVVGSLTKAWAIPGLRVGYVFARDGAEAAAVRRLRPQWSVNGLVCSALADLLDLADPVGWRDGIARLRETLVDLLRRHGFQVAPSESNYVWIARADRLRDRLLHHGILVRDGASFGHPGAVRVAVPDETGLERLATALGVDHTTQEHS